MDKIEVRLKPPERRFVKVYTDFLNCPLLSSGEKLVYIALKSFVEFGKDADNVFPSIETLCKLTSMTKNTVITHLKALVRKGVIEKNRRGLTQTNIYTLNDSSYMWQAETQEELTERAEQKVPYSTDELLRELERRGISVISQDKKSEPPSTDADQSTADSSPKSIYYSVENENTSYSAERQPLDKASAERYTVQDIEELFDFAVIRADMGDQDAEAVYNVLYDLLNTRRESIRVGAENRPTMVVIGRLMKLDYTDIEFVIRQYNKQDIKIKNPTAYLTKLLYTAKEQNRLSMLNEGHTNGDF